MESHYEKLYKCFKLFYYCKGEVVFNSDSTKNKKIVLILEGNIVDVNIIFLNFKNIKYEPLAVKGEIFGEEIINSNEK